MENSQQLISDAPDNVGVWVGSSSEVSFQAVDAEAVQSSVRRSTQVVFDPEASLAHRYGQPGGADNRHLCSLKNDSHHWYMQFFANTWYFLLKWYKLPTAAMLLLSIWREHTFSRNSLRCGPTFLLNRQRAFISGIRRGRKMAAEWNSLQNG